MPSMEPWGVSNGLDMIFSIFNKCVLYKKCKINSVNIIHSYDYYIIRTGCTDIRNNGNYTFIKLKKKKFKATHSKSLN